MKRLPRRLHQGSALWDKKTKYRPLLCMGILAAVQFCMEMNNRSNPCWSGFVAYGQKKMKNGHMVPACRPIQKSVVGALHGRGKSGRAKGRVQK